MDTLGKRLKRLRGDRTQLDVAKALGIDNSVLSRYESDEKKTIEPDLLKRLAELYGVTTDYLLSGKTPNPVAEDSGHSQEEVSEVSPEILEIFERVQRKAKQAHMIGVGLSRTSIENTTKEFLLAQESMIDDILEAQREKGK